MSYFQPKTWLNDADLPHLLSKGIHWDKHMYMETPKQIWKLQHIWKTAAKIKLVLSKGKNLSGLRPKIFSTITKGFFASSFFKVIFI